MTRHDRSRLDGVVVPDALDRARWPWSCSRPPWSSASSPRWGGPPQRWPRFLSQSVHRNLSLFCLVSDRRARGHDRGRRLCPHRSARCRDSLPHPVPADLGGLRGAGVRHAAGRRRDERTAAPHRHAGVARRALAGVRVLAGGCAPRAGTGSDTRLSVAHAVDVVCVAVGRRRHRLAAGLAGRGMLNRRWPPAAGSAGRRLLAIGIFAALGPLRPGWSHRAGTSPPLPRRISGEGRHLRVAGTGTVGTGPAGDRPDPVCRDPGGPFTMAVTGTRPATDAGGDLARQVDAPPATDAPPLVVAVTGARRRRGGAAVRSPVVLRDAGGPVTALDGRTSPRRSTDPRADGPGPWVALDRPRERPADRCRGPRGHERRTTFVAIGRRRSPMRGTPLARTAARRRPFAADPTWIVGAVASRRTRLQPDRRGRRQRVGRSGGAPGFRSVQSGAAIGRQRGRRPIVVANGAEGEPASRKDALLLTRAPHLVLDGLAAASVALRAVGAVVYVPEHCRSGRGGDRHATSAPPGPGR